MTEGIEKALKKIGVEVSKPVHALVTILFGIFVWTLPQFLSFGCGRNRHLVIFHLEKD
jgi:hypothetical protein